MYKEVQKDYVNIVNEVIYSHGIYFPIKKESVDVFLKNLINHLDKQNSEFCFSKVDKYLMRVSRNSIKIFDTYFDAEGFKISSPIVNKHEEVALSYIIKSISELVFN